MADAWRGQRGLCRVGHLLRRAQPSRVSPPCLPQPFVSPKADTHSSTTTSDEILKAAELSNPNRLGPPSNSGHSPITDPGPRSAISPAMHQPPPRPGQVPPAPSPRLANTRPQPQQLRDNGPVAQRPPGPAHANSSGSMRPAQPARNGSYDPRNAPPPRGQQPPPQQGYARQGGPAPSPGGYDPRMGGGPAGHPQQGRPDHRQDPRYDPRYQQQQQQQGRPTQQQPPPSASRGRF